MARSYLGARLRSPSDRRTDDVARHYQLHAAVHLPAGGGAVRRNRILLAEAARRNIILRDALLHQVTAHALGAFFRELLIVGVAPDAVGVAVNLQSQARVRKNDPCNL